MPAIILKQIFISLFLITAGVAELLSSESYFPEELQWFNVVSLTSHSNCRLAIELDAKDDKLIACPWNYSKPHQQWRWDGRMLKSRTNGKVWLRLDDSLYVDNPARERNRQFVTFGINSIDHRIYVDDQVFNYTKVVDLFYNPPFIGQNIFTNTKSECETQMFELNYKGLNNCII